MGRGGIGENTEGCGKWMTEVCLGVCFSGSFLMLPGSAFGRMPGRRAEAGFRPGGRPTFLSCYKKVGKEKHPNARDPCASLRGNLRRGGCGVRCGTRFALRAPLRQPQRVSRRSSPVLRQDCNPATTTPQARSYGEWVRAFASLGPGLKLSGAMAPAVGCWLLAVGCWLLAVLQPSPFCPRLRWAGCGVAALPKDRAASSSSSP